MAGRWLFSRQNIAEYARGGTDAPDLDAAALETYLAVTDAAWRAYVAQVEEERSKPPEPPTTTHP